MNKGSCLSKEKRVCFNGDEFGTDCRRASLVIPSAAHIFNKCLYVSCSNMLIVFLVDTFMALLFFVQDRKWMYDTAHGVIQSYIGIVSVCFIKFYVLNQPFHVFPRSLASMAGDFLSW